ncbi:MAG: AzlD domain-containing protein [Ottowia sp.]|jgi:uncharacterized membrane protein|nr:AzlD domain-containing protein [Ottowia sp.]
MNGWLGDLLGEGAALWGWILLACAASYLTKFSGYLMPARWLHSPRMVRVAGALTVALLAALTVLNAVSHGSALVLDARLASLLVAALALAARLPFLLVVILGAAAAAAVRYLGWG